MQQIIIDDNFFTDPEQMRKLFTNLEFVENDNVLRGKICPMQFVNDDMLNYMQQLVGVPAGVTAFEFVPGSGSFILNQETDTPSRAVCVQYPDLMTQWVGVVCLSNPPDPHFLKFYKHNRTGWDGIPTDPSKLSEERLYSYEHVDTFIQFENHQWEEKWTETSRIELKQNRLILFRPWLFHSYADVYGDSNDTARLLQFFFLKPATPKTEPEAPVEDN